MNMQQLREFVSLENRKKDLDAELKSVKQQLDDLEEALVPQFIEDGVQRMTVDGRTVSIQQDVYASPLNDREDVVDALKQSELGQYVAENYNTNSLTAFVREVKRDVELRAQSENRMYTEDDVRSALPEPLGRALKISFVHKLSSRKA
jgi:vacuolar-type H+-ATPase subunit I/STV1